MRVLRGVRFADSTCPRFSGMCWSPVPVSVVGEPDDPGSLPKSLLLQEGIRRQVTQHTRFTHGLHTYLVIEPSGAGSSPPPDPPFLRGGKGAPPDFPLLRK